MKGLEDVHVVLFVRKRMISGEFSGDVYDFFILFFSLSRFSRERRLFTSSPSRPYAHLHVISTRWIDLASGETFSVTGKVVLFKEGHRLEENQDFSRVWFFLLTRVVEIFWFVAWFEDGHVLRTCVLPVVRRRSCVGNIMFRQPVPG